ncbi:hypothetical protein K431DRAFT_122392, partial [Polychaeton citri CBS 116435]
FRSTLNLLIALDNDEDPLTFHQPFRAKEVTTTINPLLLLLFMLSFGISQALIRHAMLRVIGTRLILACVKDNKAHAKDTDVGDDLINNKSSVPTNSLTYLRLDSLSPLPLRRSLLCAIVYTVAAESCISLVSCIFSTPSWISFSRIAVALLLEGLHMRWTHAIILRNPKERWAFRYPWRELLLPALIHTVAQRAASIVPCLLGGWIATMLFGSANVTAVRDVVSLASAFATRFLVLYPSYACLICIEVGCSPGNDERAALASVNVVTSKHLGLKGYTEILGLCYRKVLFRLAALHLQTVGMLMGVELVAFMLLHLLV